MTGAPLAARRLLQRLVAHETAARIWRTLLLVLLLAILLLALLPMPPQSLNTGWDKLNHVLAFATLAVCAGLGGPASRRQRLWWFVGLLAYGALIEVLQAFTPDRQAEWGDLLADALGITLGAMLAEWALHAARVVQAARATSASPAAKP